MAKSPLLRLLALVVWFSAAGSAFAWNKAGHMVTGAIAYRALKTADPAATAKVVALLRQQPQYDQYWKKQVESMEGEDGEMMLFMLAARWADDIRSRPEFTHDLWHYIDYPYHPPSTATAKPKEVGSDNIIDALELNRGLVKSAPDAAARSVAVCWVMHLTGDLHQPLHSTQMFRADFPKGDHGGTAAFIRVEEGETLSLHQLWDGLVIGSDRFQAVRNTATELAARPDLATAKFGPQLLITAPDKWALNESFPLAVKYVYRNGDIGLGSSKSNGIALPADYLAQAKPVAERQITLAGYRIAATLRALMK